MFSPGDKVLAFLPISGSALQACYSGPYAVTSKVGNLDYLIATPDHKKKNLLCHVNMLKAHHEHAVECPVKAVLVSAPAPPSEAVDGVTEPSRCVVEGRLKNSEMLCCMSERLSHLSHSNRADILELIESHCQL